MFAGHPVEGVLPDGALYACTACGLAFRFPILAAHDYDVLYGDASSDCWADDPGRTDWALVEEYLSQHAPEGARVLDFGCHTGGLLQRLGARYLKTGVEVNPGAARLARERTGTEIVARLDALASDKRFDIVTAVDVVEHFPDPGEVMASLLDVLARGGTLVVTTGDAGHWLAKVTGARWWYCYFPEHLAFISEPWARGWLARSGVRAQLVLARRFRHARLSPVRTVLQASLVPLYLAAPRFYLRLGAAARKALRRGDTAYPPGGGLTKDHLLLVLKRPS
ncbi:MAG: class I SAM-dependent methyltransferase [Burkholderiales bacterium]